MENKKDLLLRISKHLIINAGYLKDLGLWHGKMGVVLFFAHYAKYTQNSLYDEFAGKLMDQIYEEIHLGLPVDFENGLCGIGWATEYLLQNGFMKGDSNEILVDFDQKIMERDLRKISDRTLRAGLQGIVCYVSSRLESCVRQGNPIPFESTYLSEFENASKGLERLQPDCVLQEIIKGNEVNENIADWPLGLENGCAGLGLKLIVL